MQKLEVRLLEEALGWAFRVRRVGDDDVKSISVLVQELEAVPDVDLDLFVGKAGGHLREVFLG